MKTILNWVISAIVIGIAAYLVPGVTVTPIGALVAAVVLGALNLFIKPILVILTLPITILTLGLFSLVINAALIMLASAVVPGFTVASFWTAVIFGIVLAVVNWVLNIWSRN